MRAVIQRVSHASVTINGTVKSAIQQGFLILLGVCDEDTMEDVDWLVKKIANLRVFGDENDVMNRSILDVQGEALVVSQFTLFASYKKGNRPSWFRAGSHEHSIPLYEAFCRDLSEAIGKPVGTRIAQRRTRDHLYGHQKQGVMKLIRNEKLKQLYKWELHMLPIVILLVVAEIYFCKEKMLIPAWLDVITLVLLRIYKNSRH